MESIKARLQIANTLKEHVNDSFLSEHHLKDGFCFYFENPQWSLFPLPVLTCCLNFVSQVM